MKKRVCTLEELREIGEKKKLYCFGGGWYLLSALFSTDMESFHFEEIVHLIMDNDPCKDDTEIVVRSKAIPVRLFKNCKDMVDENVMIIISVDNKRKEIEQQLCTELWDKDVEYCILKDIIHFYRQDDSLKKIIKTHQMKISRIPKIIHWCWFGGNELPAMQQKCVRSWTEKCPDYEVKLWNEETFDLKTNQFAWEAYKNKKYAFVADYVRLWSIYHFGGIYLDSDVEVVRDLDPFLCHSAFSGFENRFYIPTGIMGGEKGNSWYEYLLSYYDDRNFVTENGLDLTTNVRIISDMTFGRERRRFQNGYYELQDVTLYPCEVFCPMNWETRELNITDNTYCIHWFAGSWVKKDKEKSASY